MTATRPASPETMARETTAAFGEGLMLQPPQASPMAGLDGSGKPPLTFPMAGSDGVCKASAAAMWPASPESETRETTTVSWPASSVPTVVPPLMVTAQPSSADTTTAMAQPLTASTVTVLGTQSGPWYIPQGSGIPWGPWPPPQPFMGGIPCPTQEQQSLPPWLQPLSSLQQLATLDLPQALPARMPLWPGLAPQPPSSGAPHGLAAPSGATSSTPGPSLSGSSRQQSLMQMGSSLARLDPRVITCQSPTVTLPRGRNGMEASEQGLDEPPADQQLWSFADSLSQLGKYAPSALVEGGRCLSLFKI